MITDIIFTENEHRRFWSKVEKGDGCWEWQGAKNRQGYGVFYFRQKAIGAHRASFMSCVGHRPKHLWVLHKCDNPCCVRPDHLWLGTVKDNAMDMLSKGRASWITKPERVPRGNSHYAYGKPGINRGSAIGTSVLTESSIVEIRALLAKGETHKSIGAIFGVDPSTIYHVRAGKTWAHV